MEDKVIIVTAPSGAGKTTLVNMLLKDFPQLAFSVSACTRDKRNGEVDGKDYYFIGLNEFKLKIAQGAFVEFEEVYPGNYYGTLKSELDKLWNQHKVVVFDIDVQGAASIKNKLGNKALSVFIMPPSKEILFQRLKDRKTETEEKIQMRIQKADKELDFASKFDFCIVNDDLQKAYQQLSAIVSDFIQSGQVLQKP